MEFKHKSVMLNEVTDTLNLQPHGIYLDCTLGGGGHSLKIGENLNADAISAAREKLSGVSCFMILEGEGVGI